MCHKHYTTHTHVNENVPQFDLLVFASVCVGLKLVCSLWYVLLLHQICQLISLQFTDACGAFLCKIKIMKLPQQCDIGVIKNRRRLTAVLRIKI